MDDAKAKLVVKLQAAEEAYKENPKQGVSQALLAICSHLEALEIPPNLSEPIFALIMALDDVEHGTKNPLLKVQKLNHRAPFPIAERQARAHAAAALELLFRTDPKLSLHQAALKVARSAKNWPWYETKNVNANAIIKWREQAMSGLAGEDFDTTTFNEILKYAESCPLENKSIAQTLLDKPPPWMR
jgi:hypothetical protein